MRKFDRIGLFLLGSLALVRPAQARDIPVQVSWSGDSPTGIVAETVGGAEPLSLDAVKHRFVGRMSVPDTGPQHGVITVQYGSYYYPFEIRLNPRIDVVSIPIYHHVQRSCTSQRVRAAEATARSWPEAIELAVNAGELLSIQGNDACFHDTVHDLRYHVIHANYKQAIAINNYSNGLIRISTDIEEQYRQAALAKGIPVDTQIDSEELMDGVREVKRLRRASLQAESTGDYQKALDINDYMETRIQSGEDARKLYQTHGVTKANLEADNVRLEQRLKPADRVFRAGERGLR